MWSRLLGLLVLTLAAPAVAQSTSSASVAGSWALKLDGAIIFRFDIKPDGDGWRGDWWRPRSFASNGDSFSRLGGPPVEVVSGGSKTIGDAAEITFPDNRPGAVPDVFRFHLINPDRVEMVYEDTGLAPFILVRVSPSASLGPWEPGHVYRRVSVATLGLPKDAGPSVPVVRFNQGEAPPPDADKPPAMVGR